eukprot:TRINITY_DN30828_c0_g1_i1.p1 TRINITY_DN30828_c0_g1~~TRINITY_DN30828_c0_g1_i1.p1  ORF type:complete len:290 (-),score=79.25 TRINITY_DN30828_c0_g1_i1:185-1006(-)
MAASLLRALAAQGGAPARRPPLPLLARGRAGAAAKLVECSRRFAAIADVPGVFASTWFEGTVVSASADDVFVDVLLPGRPAPMRGRCPNSRVADAVLAPGRRVHVRVLGAEDAGDRAASASLLSLSMLGHAAAIEGDLRTQLQRLRGGSEGPTPAAAAASSPSSTGPRPLPPAATQDLSAFEALPKTLWLEGVVHHMASYGAYIELRPPAAQPLRRSAGGRGSDGGRSGEPGAWGLVHLTQLGTARDLRAGQRVRVRILAVDAAAGRLTLSMV